MVCNPPLLCYVGSRGWWVWGVCCLSLGSGYRVFVVGPTYVGICAPVGGEGRSGGVPARRVYPNSWGEAVGFLQKSLGFGGAPLSVSVAGVGGGGLVWELLMLCDTIWACVVLCLCGYGCYVGVGM